MKSHSVIIKGTKEGLIFVIDENCSFQEVLDDLRHKLTSAPKHDQDEKVTVIVDFGYRYVSDDQKEEIASLIEGEERFLIERFEGNVISKDKAQQLIEEREIKSFIKIVRSGQVLEVSGDLLLLGDVNPGGEVRATGNIYVMGKLQGIAHAGTNGNEAAIIVASYMNPNQLRIANTISRTSDQVTEEVHMEYGYIDKESNQITVEKLHTLPFKYKNLNHLEGGLTNG